MIDNAYFSHLLQRSLLFNIPKIVDFISFKIIENNIDVFIISKRKLTEQERGYIYSAISEVEGDFVEYIEIDVNFVVMEKLPDDLKSFGNVLFAFVE